MINQIIEALVVGVAFALTVIVCYEAYKRAFK